MRKNNSKTIRGRRVWVLSIYKGETKDKNGKYDGKGELVYVALYSSFARVRAAYKAEAPKHRWGRVAFHRCALNGGTMVAA
jgi:hypothetical protein